MKKIVLTCLIIIYYVNTFAQIKGNAISVSRQNIASKDLGNSYVYGKPSNGYNPAQLIPNSVVTIDVKALANIVASSHTAVFNVMQIGNTSEETSALINERIQNLKTELQANGIANSDIVIDVISFVPVYETVVEKKLFSKKYVEVPKGFELQENIHIKFTNVNQFEAILLACAKQEIFNLVKVDYYIDNLQEVYAKLRQEILKELQLKQQFYKNIGIDINQYTLNIADNKYCYFPRDFYKSYQAFNSISLEVLKKNKSVSNVKKQTSYYYDPIPFNNYDIVINPSIVAPVIQIGMEIKLQYTPNKKEQKPTIKEVLKPKYFLIAPNGDMEIKELQTS